MLLGRTRVFSAMSRDGLLPRFFSQVHPRFTTPRRATILLGVIIAIVAGFTSLSGLVELVNIGTLFAFRSGLDQRAGPGPYAPRSVSGLPRAVGTGSPRPRGGRVSLAHAEPADGDLAQGRACPQSMRRVTLRSEG